MDSIQSYLNSIKHYSVHSHEEHVKLFNRYRDAVNTIENPKTPEDKNKAEKIRDKTFDKIVTSNLKFVVSVAKQYIKYKIDFNELISAGNEGLIRAVKNFDPDKNYKFTTYAVWWIRQAMFQTITESTNLIHIPSNRQYDLQRIRKLEEKKVQELERFLTQEELIELSKYNNLSLIDLNNVISLNDLDSNDNELVHTLLSPSENIEQSVEDLDTREFINELLEDCSFKERDILSLYFGLDDIKPLTLEKIGRMYNLSRERIRQIKCLALEKLNKCKKRSYE